MYATRAFSESQWTFLEVDSGLFDSELNTSAAVDIALDDQDRPNIAYTSYVTHELRYSRWDGTSWVRMDGMPGYDVLDLETDYVSPAQHFLIMHGGAPHLAMAHYTDLNYYFWSGTAWVGETALSLTEDLFTPGGSPSLAFDSQGVPHVAHHDFDGYHLHYAKRTGSTWTDEELPSPELSILYKRIAIDAHDRPHILFNHGYTRWDGAAWVNASGAPGWDEMDLGYLSPAISDDGEIFALERSAGMLQVRRKMLEGTSWGTPEPVPAVAVWTGSMAVDGASIIHLAVSVAAADSYDLEYLSRIGSVWTSEVVATGMGFHREVQPAIAVR
jgi:hypothetical protein